MAIIEASDIKIRIGGAWKSLKDDTSNNVKIVQGGTWQDVEREKAHFKLNTDWYHLKPLTGYIPDNLIAGATTNRNASSLPSSHLIRSVNGAWQACDITAFVSKTATNGPFGIAQNPITGTIIITTVGGKVLRSTDKGVTWNATLNTGGIILRIPLFVSEIVPASPYTCPLIIATHKSNPARFYISWDDGITFSTYDMPSGILYNSTGSNLESFGNGVVLYLPYIESTSPRNGYATFTFTNNLSYTVQQYTSSTCFFGISGVSNSYPLTPRLRDSKGIAFLAQTSDSALAPKFFRMLYAGNDAYIYDDLATTFDAPNYPQSTKALHWSTVASRYVRIKDNISTDLSFITAALTSKASFTTGLAADSNATSASIQSSGLRAFAHSEEMPANDGALVMTALSPAAVDNCAVIYFGANGTIDHIDLKTIPFAPKQNEIWSFVKGIV
jgi:hypothetical protein